MRIIDIVDFNQAYEEKERELKSDYYKCRETHSQAAAVAEWGLELLKEFKEIVLKKSFDATINKYNSPRNGEEK